jgi:hypothetical protein
LNLSFKIILIRKSQVSIFIKYLKLFEFENVFVFKLSFELKFKICLKEFAMQFLFFFFGWPKAIQPKSKPISRVWPIWPTAPIISFLGTAAPPPSFGHHRHPPPQLTSHTASAGPAFQFPSPWCCFNA